MQEQVVDDCHRAVQKWAALEGGAVATRKDDSVDEDWCYILKEKDTLSVSGSDSGIAVVLDGDTPFGTVPWSNNFEMVAHDVTYREELINEEPKPVLDFSCDDFTATIFMADDNVTVQIN